MTVSDNVEPAAVLVIFPVPSKEVPFIVLAVARAVAVAAFWRGLLDGGVDNVCTQIAALCQATN